MNKIADYYQRISEYQKAFSCRDEAKTFSTNHSNQPQKNSSGDRTQSNAFTAAFEKIDELIADDEDSYRIKSELVSLEYRARNNRDADAMNKIADYYQRISEYRNAFACRDEAKTFAR